MAQDPAGTPPTPWQAVALEATASLVAVAAVVLVPLHFVATRMSFLGAEAVISADNVRFHRILLVVIALAVVASFAGAAWGRRRKAFGWHLAVAVAGVVVALAFPINETGPVQDLDDPVEQQQPGRPGGGGGACHSGGDSDGCLGG